MVLSEEIAIYLKKLFTWRLNIGWLSNIFVFFFLDKYMYIHVLKEKHNPLCINQDKENTENVLIYKRVCFISLQKSLGMIHMFDYD